MKVDTGDIIKQSTHRITDADDYSHDEKHIRDVQICEQTIDDFLHW